MRHNLKKSPQTVSQHRSRDVPTQKLQMEGRFETFPLKYFVEKALEVPVPRGLLLLSFLLKLNHLGHQRLSGVDECCHALVARNLLKHPLKLPLIETPYLSLLSETGHQRNNS